MPEPLLVVSVIGTAVTSLVGLLVLGGMRVMGEANERTLTVFPVLVAALLTYYARAMSSSGVLR